MDLNTRQRQPTPGPGWVGPIRLCPKFYRQETLAAEKKIARQALSAKTGLDNLFVSDQSKVISCFIEAGETQAAHDLVKTSELLEHNCRCL